MKIIILLSFSLLIFNNSYGQGYGSGYDQQGSYGQQNDQQQGVDPNQAKKGTTGLERKGLLDSMDITDKTKLTDVEKCKTKCEMTFTQCYRLQTDRAKCYSVQQECLGKCGGDTAETNPDFTSPQQGGQLELGSGGY
jgi:hypothetical protein